MTLKEQESFIRNMYEDLFRNADSSKIAKYCTPDFIEENNYDVLNYNTFVEHVESLNDSDLKVSFDIEFIVNAPKQVVIRTIVTIDDTIKGAPPHSLLISYWQFSDDGKVNYCKEVESSE